MIGSFFFISFRRFSELIIAYTRLFLGFRFHSQNFYSFKEDSKVAVKFASSANMEGSVISKLFGKSFIPEPTARSAVPGVNPGEGY